MPFEILTDYTTAVLPVSTAKFGIDNEIIAIETQPNVDAAGGAMTFDGETSTLIYTAPVARQPGRGRFVRR